MVGSRLIKLAQNHDLTQMVKKQTRTTEITSSTIDLVFTSQPKMISTVSVIPAISDHDAVRACIHIKPKYTRQHSWKIYLYNKGNYQSMKAPLQQGELSEHEGRYMPTYSSAFFESAPEKNTVEYNLQQFRCPFQESMNNRVLSKMSKTRFSMPWVHG